MRVGIRTVGLIVLTILLLTGCSGTTAGTAAPGTVRVTTDSIPAEPTPSSAALDSTAPTVSFGDINEWPDGLTVTVSAGEPFTPNERAPIDGQWGSYLSFDVTVVNNTGTPFRPNLFTIDGMSGGRDAEQVFDAYTGYLGSPVTTILDGRTSNYAIGFGVAFPKDVIISVTPGLDYATASFGPKEASDPAATATVTATPTNDNPYLPWNPEVVKFGDTVSYDDGLQVTVSTGTPFTPRENLPASVAEVYLVYSVTIKNDSGRDYSPFNFAAWAESAGTAAEPVDNSGRDPAISAITLEPILNKSTSTFTIGFGVIDPADVVMEVFIDFDHVSTIFTT